MGTMSRNPSGSPFHPLSLASDLCNSHCEVCVGPESAAAVATLADDLAIRLQACRSAAGITLLLGCRRCNRYVQTLDGPPHLWLCAAGVAVTSCKA